MTNRRIEIDVVLNTEQVDRGFQEIEQGGKEVGKTFTGIGETFTGVGSAIGSMGDEATQKLGAVGESANSAIGAVMSLGDSARTTAGGFSALIAPIGLVGVAVFEVVRAWSEYQDEVQGVNIRHDAYIASVSELTSALEELATNQVKLNRAEVERLQNLSMEAKLEIESAQGIREKNAELDKRIYRATIQIEQQEKAAKQLKEQLKNDKRLQENAQLYGFALSNLEKIESNINKLKLGRTKLEDKLRKKEQEAIDKGLEGSRRFAEFEDFKENLLKRSPKVQAEIDATTLKLQEDAALNKLKLAEQTEKTLTKIAIIESNRRIREIRAMEMISLKDRNDAVIAEEERLDLQIAEIQKQAAIKEEQRQQKRRARAAARRAKRLANERKLEGELRQIRSLEIDQMEINGEKAEKILFERYQLELQAAKDNKNQKLIADMRYQNALTQLQINAQNEREANEAAAAISRQQQEEQAFQHRRNFIMQSMEFDLQILDDGLDKELKLLEFRYQKEIELNKHTQEEITELNRREAIERKQIQDNALNEQFTQLAELGKQLAASAVDSAYGAIVAQGEFKKGIGEAVFALGKQAAVQSVFQGATALARLATGDVAGAAIAGKAAAGYGAAAAIAGVAANRLGVGGGGGGGGGDVSPTSLPLTQATPDREQAETREIVYNINFGGAVIYDTKTAAEQALADRLTNLQNQNRRGSPRRRGV